MKRVLCSLLLVLFVAAPPALAQSRVKAKDLTGTWKLVIDLEVDREESESALERIALNFADGIMDEIDIHFEFRDDQEVKVLVNAFGEDDVEYSSWEINDRGQLMIGESDHFDSDGVWMWDGDVIRAYDKSGNRLEAKENVYLKRID